MKITKAELQKLLAEANSAADIMTIQLQNSVTALAAAEAKAKSATNKLAKKNASIKSRNAKLSPRIASVAVDSEGCLSIALSHHAAVSGAYPITVAADRITFAADDSLNIVMELAEPHLDSLSAFFVADLNDLRANLLALDTEYTVETDALRRELRKGKRVINAVASLLSRAGHAKVGA